MHLQVLCHGGLRDPGPYKGTGSTGPYKGTGSTGPYKGTGSTWCVQSNVHAIKLTKIHKFIVPMWNTK